MLEGDQWQYGEPPTAEELERHAKQNSVLLVRLPNYMNPYELVVKKLSPNREYVQVEPAGGRRIMRGAGDWFDITRIRILDVMGREGQYHNSPLRNHDCGLI